MVEKSNNWMRMVERRKYTKLYLSIGGFELRDFELFEYIAILYMFGFLGKICFVSILTVWNLQFWLISNSISGIPFGFPQFSGILRKANYSPHWRMAA
jgi:hypothetical protein